MDPPKFMEPAPYLKHTVDDKRPGLPNIYYTTILPAISVYFGIWSHAGFL